MNSAHAFLKKVGVPESRARMRALISQATDQGHLESMCIWAMEARAFDLALSARYLRGAARKASGAAAPSMSNDSSIGDHHCCVVNRNHNRRSGGLCRFSYQHRHADVLWICSCEKEALDTFTRSREKGSTWGIPTPPELGRR
jgi:hypothetical protein